MKKVNRITNVKFDFLTSNKKYFGFEWWGIAIMVGVFAVELYPKRRKTPSFSHGDIRCGNIPWGTREFTLGEIV